MKRSLITLVSVLAMAGCENKTTTETKPENTPASSASAAATAAPTPAIADSDLATPADFEQAAETSITKATYKSDLDALEADIASPTRE